MEKAVKYSLISYITLVVVYMTLGNLSPILSALNDLMIYIPTFIFLRFIWLLFPDKIIRGFTFPIGTYFIYRCVLTAVYRYDVNLFDTLNTKYHYLFSLGIGLVFLAVYLVYKFKRHGRMDKK